MSTQSTFQWRKINNKGKKITSMCFCASLFISPDQHGPATEEFELRCDCELLLKSALRLGAISPGVSAEHSHRLRNQTASVSAVATCWTICFLTRSIPSKGIAAHHAGVWSWVRSCAPFVLDRRGDAPQPPPTVKRLWPSAALGRRPAARRLVPQGCVRNVCTINLLSCQHGSAQKSASYEALLSLTTSSGHRRRTFRVSGNAWFWMRWNVASV